MSDQTSNGQACIFDRAWNCGAHKHFQQTHVLSNAIVPNEWFLCEYCVYVLILSLTFDKTNKNENRYCVSFEANDNRREEEGKIDSIDIHTV